MYGFAGQVDGIVEAIRGELGPHIEVESHIEPQPERMLLGEEAPAHLTAEVSAALEREALDALEGLGIRFVVDGVPAEPPLSATDAAASAPATGPCPIRRC